MNTYDLIIIGGGPAGVSAGVYAARKLLKTVVIAEEIGGQSVVSADIQNWIGFPSISGFDLSKAFRKHLDTYKGDVVEIVEGSKVSKLEKKERLFEITTEKGDSFSAKAVLIASGANRRRLSIPGADELEHKGVTYCASCDGPLFSSMDVAVIGGGNAGFETAAQLLAYTKSVTLLHRGDSYTADPSTVKTVLANEKMTGILNANTTKILGDKFVSGLMYTDKDGDEKKLDVQGVFVEIGLIPSTDFAKDVVEMDEINRIKIDPRTQKTSIEGVWAAGDVTDGLYHQNNIAAGDAVKALEDIYMYLKAS